MAQVQVLVKQPSEFEFGDDFGLFFDRFMAFIRHSKCDLKSQYNLFLSYLDDTSFKKVRAIEFTAENKTENAIDLEKSLQLLKTALTKDDVPINVQLRYRRQKPDESMDDFGDAVRSLGQLLYDTGCETNSMVIETFCVGLSDSDLSAKLLQKKFETLTSAMKYANSRKQNKCIKSFLAENTAGQSSALGQDITVLPANVQDVPRQTGNPNMAGQVSNPPKFYNNRSQNANVRYDRPSYHNNQSQDVRYDRPSYHNNQGQNVRYNGPNNRSNQGQSYGAPKFQYSQQRETRTCHFCSEAGHLQKFCPKRKFDQGDQKYNNVVCHRCHQRGHIRKFCDNRNTNFQ